jgi:flagellar biosynthesis/type III secretory pathway chaperone
MMASQEPLHTLQDALVKEFRACQALIGLLDSERLALSAGDTVALSILARQKEALLDSFERLELTRQQAICTLAAELGLERPSCEAPELDEVCRALEVESAQQLARLQEGIQVLLEAVRDHTQGNLAITTAALERSSALQERLVNQCLQPPVSASPAPPVRMPREHMGIFQSADPTPLPAIFAAIMAARDALHSEDRTALSNAASALQNALERLGYRLEGGSPEQTSATPHSPESSPSLIEKIARLYQQESVYHASLQASERTLAGV